MALFGRSEDEQAVERYRYMLRTAPPDTIEKAHMDAFAKLTPEQRQLALQQLAQVTPPEERRYVSEDPQSLARLATRAEIRQPGILERLFGGVRPGSGAGFGFGSGIGLGGMFAGSLLASLAGSFIGSAIAESFFDDHPMDSHSLHDTDVLAPEEIDTPLDDGLDHFTETELDEGFELGDTDDSLI